MNKVIFKKDIYGNLVFLSTGKEKNYISGKAELENIKVCRSAEGIVIPFGGITLDVQWKGGAFSGTPDMKAGQGFYLYEEEAFRLQKSWKEENGELKLIVSVRNEGSSPLTVRELSVSMPFNNNYTRFQFEQRYIYDHKTCEHYYECGKSSYLMAEKLGGGKPLLYCLCEGETSIEHIRKNKATISYDSRGLLNHSWPGSLDVMLVAGSALQALAGKVSHSGSCPILQPGEEKTFALAFGFAENRQAFDELRVERGQVVLDPVTPLTLPQGLSFVFEVKSLSPVEVESEGGTLKALGDGRYSLSYGSPGEKRVWVRNGAYCAEMLVFVTDSLERLCKARAKFILNKQVYKKPGDILDHAIVPYAEKEFAGRTGLVVEEGSLWGTGSYEGGICDAAFAAQKNVLWPDQEEIDRLEEYVDKYLLRYLQDPETLKVNWFGYRAAEDRSYNYVHVANFYFAMFRIAEIHHLTKHDQWRYLDLAARTLDVMFEVSRPMDLACGNMGHFVILEILDAFARLGSVDRYWILKQKLIRMLQNMFYDTPYASECAYDNTGYEAVVRFCMLLNKKEIALELASIIAANKGNQPLWYRNGSDIRWWDGAFDFCGECHHYTSPYNSAALVNLMADTDWLKPDKSLCASAYGGLTGVLAKIREDGFASMCFGPEPESQKFGFHCCTGDFGVGGFALLKNLTAFSFRRDGIRNDYLCEGEGEEYLFPSQTVQNFCLYGEHKITLRLDNGFLEKVGWQQDALVIEAFRPCGGASKLSVRSNLDISSVEGASFFELKENMFSVDLPPVEKKVRIRILFYPLRRES